MKAAFAITAIVVSALLALGVVMLYSATMPQVGARYTVLQLTWCGLGVVVCILAASIDYRVLRNLAWPGLGLAVVLLALVLEPHIGRKINGARRWLDVGGFRLQPSELAKLALVIALAAYAGHHPRRMSTFWQGIGFPMVFIGMVLALIVVEPDRGTTILLAAVAGTMLVLAGVRLIHILPLVLAGMVGFGIYLVYDSMVSARFGAWLHPEAYQSGVSYQVSQSIIAIGSGGFFGKGVGGGTMKSGYVPELSTDFIFSAIGEELGLMGTVGVVIAFAILIGCGLNIAVHARDNFGMLLAAGITMLIGLQAFVNMGVVTGILPNKGLPLPFISYGGSNLVVMLTAVGILLSIARRASTGGLRQE